MLLGFSLLVIPWLSYLQLIEMERLLIQSRENVQLLLARGISTLFNGRDDLFNDLPLSYPLEYEPLYVHPLTTSIRLDGHAGDWGSGLTEKAQHFGPAGADGSFDLLLAERNDQLYIYLNVIDDRRVYRSPGYLRLDTADHVRINFFETNGTDGRITLTLHEPGVASAYRMSNDWRFAATGAPPANEVQGSIAETESGYGVEFRLPLSMMGSRKGFAVSFADVDNQESREIRNIVQTLPKGDKESFNLVVFRSPQVLNIIQGLGYSGARIQVIDSQRRTRAETGSYGTIDSANRDNPAAIDTRAWFTTIRPLLHKLIIREEWRDQPQTESDSIFDRALTSALDGQPSVLRRVTDDAQIIVALHPIVSKDKTLGAVIVQQNMAEILTFQEAAIEQIVLFSILSLLAVFVVLLAFSVRLAWRIRGLRREANAAIDPYGRLRASALQSEVKAGDEIGDLARSIDNMLKRLNQHNTFIENMPRTLRHEINNPLNTLSTSLQNLENESESVRNSKYLESAKRGVLRIGAIVQNLADAANLEESLETEELETLDIEKLIENYVANFQLTHENHRFVFRGTGEPVLARVSDYRIEQLLDKIIDNAIDFHRPESPIKVQLDTYREHLQISVANRGPALPRGAGESLFESMVSHRGRQSRLHFGLGLYVVRLIAEHHGGSVYALDLPDSSGVAFMVRLPLSRIRPPTPPKFDKTEAVETA
jgi:dedicated sortase system histidine kinase